MIDNNKAQKYFETVRDAVRRERVLMQSVESATEKMDGLKGVRYDKQPGSPNATDSMICNIVADYADIVRKAQDAANTAAMLVHDGFNVIQRMRDGGVDPVDTLIIEQYYLWDKTTSEVAEMAGMSISRLKHRKSEALTVAIPFVR